MSAPHPAQRTQPGEPRIPEDFDRVTSSIQTEATDAIVAARGLAPADLEIRLRADASSRLPVLVCYASAVVWLIIGSLFGEIASLKLHWPDLLTRDAWLTFGRIRTAHLTTVNYGWGSLAMIGTSLWLMPRLVHSELRHPKLATVGAVLWNIGLVIGVAGILAGVSDGMEWLEMSRWYADPWLVVGGGMIGLALFSTVAARRAEHLYVSVWYILSAFLWFPMLFVLGNWPTWVGVESAAVNWLFAHNVLGFWLTAVSVGVAYYFIPKVLGRPIYSYQLSILGFWTFAFFYALNGMHHLVGGPLPTWMITTSIVASVLMFIPVVATAINLHMTVVGRFGALRYSPTLRFVVLGAMGYTAVSLQGSFTALREVNRVTHFTHWTIAHSHVGVYGFVTFIMFGAMYYVIPRLVRHEWPSASLIRWHFGLVFAGITLYVVALTWAGVAQGLALLDPRLPFEASVSRAHNGLIGRSLGGLLMTIGHFVFAWHVWVMFRGRAVAAVRPPFHEARPILYTAPAAGAVTATLTARRDAPEGA